MVAWRAAASIFASSAAERPVVPMTWTTRACAESPAKATVEAGAVKSSTPSIWAKTGRGSSVIAMPSGARPAISPTSRPTCGEPLASMAPATAQPGVSTSTRVSAWPMRPAAPRTANLMSLIGGRPSRKGPAPASTLESPRCRPSMTAKDPAHKSPRELRLTPRRFRVGGRGQSWEGRLGSCPGEGHFAQRDIAEALGALGDGLAAETEIEPASGVIVGESPDEQSFEPELGEPAAGSVEQFLPEAEALIDRVQIELEDLALELRAQARTAIGYVARRFAAEVEHEKRRPLAERGLPPALPAPGDHALERKMRDDALIGVAPGLFVGGGESLRVLQSRRPDMHDIDGHGVSLAQEPSARQRGRKNYPAIHRRKTQRARRRRLAPWLSLAR